MNIASIMQLITQLTALGMKLYAEGNRTATPDEIATVLDEFQASDSAISADIARRGV